MDKTPIPRDQDVDNRRAYSRLPVSLEVTFESDHNFFTGLTENISEGGLFIATHSSVQVGERFQITFSLKTMARPVQVMCEVRWIRPYHEGLEAPPGFGVRFLDLDPVIEKAIQNFLHARNPIFYEE